MRDQLEKWKESEEDHARVIALSNAKLLASRPKTVDSGAAELCTEFECLLTYSWGKLQR